MNEETISGLAGFVMPFLVEIIKAKLPETEGKWLGYVLSYGLCLVVGGVTALASGKFDTQNILSSTASALITSQGLYNLYFKPKNIDKKMQKALQ